MKDRIKHSAVYTYTGTNANQAQYAKKTSKSMDNPHCSLSAAIHSSFC